MATHINLPISIASIITQQVMDQLVFPTSVQIPLCVSIFHYGDNRSASQRVVLFSGRSTISHHKTLWGVSARICLSAINNLCCCSSKVGRHLGSWLSHAFARGVFVFVLRNCNAAERWRREAATADVGRNA